jgi:hypothetical protein
MSQFGEKQEENIEDKASKLEIDYLHGVLCNVDVFLKALIMAWPSDLSAS